MFIILEPSVYSIPPAVTASVPLFVPPWAMLAYLRVQERHERELLFALKRSASRIDRELRALERKSGIGAAVRRDQLRLSKAAIQREIASLWRLLGSQVEASRAEAAAAAVKTMHTYDAVLLRAVMSQAEMDLLLRGLLLQAERGVSVVETRVLGMSRISLSDRVWRSRVLVSGQLDRVIDNALARGVSARELADDVRAFVNPNTKGGVRYAANRLARTEINNAFHGTQIRQAQQVPWITGMQWQLSGSHPRPDECDTYANESHYDGGDAGVFLPAEVPAKPHPNCLCFTTPVVPDRSTFISQYQAGAYDSFIDEVMRTGGVVVV